MRIFFLKAIMMRIENYKNHFFFEAVEFFIYKNEGHCSDTMKTKNK